MRRRTFVEATPATCHDVMAAAASVLLRRSLRELPSSATEHIAGCGRCAAALVTLVRSLDDALADPPPCSCDACEAALPAYIDLDATDAALAATMYPSVWWHLWHCAHCDELYRSVLTLLRQMPADLPTETKSFQPER